MSVSERKKRYYDMAGKRYIIVMENGKKIYEGEDNRVYGRDYENKVFGILKVEDVIKLVAYLCLLLGFLYKSDARITKVEESQTELIKITSHLVDFANNSDKWHSSVTGTNFNGGKPDGYLNNKRARELFREEKEN